MPGPKLMIDESKTKKPPKPSDPRTEQSEKKEFTPKVRNAGHFLFVQNENHLMQVASYPDLKSFQDGIKEKAKAVPDGEEIPNWVHFRGKFKKIEIERIRDVRLKL